MEKEVVFLKGKGVEREELPRIVARKGNNKMWRNDATC